MTRAVPLHVIAFRAEFAVVLRVFDFNHKGCQMPGPKIDLASFVTAVREGLESTEQDMTMTNRSPLFELESFELEVHFVMSSSETDERGFDLKVISLGLESESKSEEVHTLKLKYKVPQKAIDEHIPGARAHGSTHLPTKHDNFKPL
jgi:hypothetical protein